MQASGHAGRRVAGCLAALAGALLWPRAGVGLLAGLLAYGAWTARTDAVWRRAVHQYVSILAGRAQIEGIDMEGAASPLVQ